MDEQNGEYPVQELGGDNEGEKTPCNELCLLGVKYGQMTGIQCKGGALRMEMNSTWRAALLMSPRRKS